MKSKPKGRKPREAYVEPPPPPETELTRLVDEKARKVFSARADFFDTDADLSHAMSNFRAHPEEKDVELVAQLMRELVRRVSERDAAEKELTESFKLEVLSRKPTP